MFGPVFLLSWYDVYPELMRLKRLHSYVLTLLSLNVICTNVHKAITSNNRILRISSTLRQNSKDSIALLYILLSSTSVLEHSFLITGIRLAEMACTWDWFQNSAQLIAHQSSSSQLQKYWHPSREWVKKMCTDLITIFYANNSRN